MFRAEEKVKIGQTEVLLLLYKFEALGIVYFFWKR